MAGKRGQTIMGVGTALTDSVWRSEEAEGVKQRGQNWLQWSR